MKIVLMLLANVIVFIVLLGCVEGFFRLFVKERGTGEGLNWQTLRPYVMFSTPQNPARVFVWDDQLHKKQIKAEITNDDYGFAMTEPVSLSHIRAKGASERVVVLTGGSAMWGVGASSDAT